MIHFVTKKGLYTYIPKIMWKPELKVILLAPPKFGGGAETRRLV
jgi:hypothetical protein